MSDYTLHALSCSDHVSGGAPSNLADTEKRAIAVMRALIAQGKKERFSKTMNVSPSMANVMMSLNSHNRPISPLAVEKWALVMADGRWMLTSEAISFSKDGVLIDGQHRLSAVIKSGVTVPMTIWCGCNSEEFSVINQGKSRTAGHLLAIDGLNNYNLRAYITQLILRLEKRSIAAFPPQVVRQKALDLQSKAMDESLARGNQAAKIVNPAIAALAWMVISRDTTMPKQKLDEFWNGMVSGANLPPRSPILKLREQFKNYIKLLGSNRDKAIKGTAIIIQAWNAYAKHNIGRDWKWEHVIELPPVI